jgi:hypothetical protein
VKEELSIQKYLWFKVYKTNDEFVPPQALKSFYLSHIDDFTTPIEVSFRYITIKLSRDNRVDVLVDFVKKGLKEGKDFVELARKVAEYQGEDPEQAAVLFTKSFDALQSWVKPTADVLKTLKKGEVSDVVPTPLDVRFFKVENLKQGTRRNSRRSRKRSRAGSGRRPARARSSRSWIGSGAKSESRCSCPTFPIPQPRRSRKRRRARRRRPATRSSSTASSQPRSSRRDRAGEISIRLAGGHYDLRAFGRGSHGFRREKTRTATR